VIEITGRPFSDNDSWESYESIYDLHAIGLERPRHDLDARIECRVDSMLRSGLVDEARGLETRGLSRTARMALGYRQVLDHPDASLDELRELIVRATKRFARRQESWFRSDPRVAWAGADSSEAVYRGMVRQTG
jgi:tRNA dimethylallyltransferase